MPRPGFNSIERISHRAAIAGTVIDLVTQHPLAFAQVAISDGPEAFKARLAALRHGRPDQRPDRRTADASGFFRWIDLPVGSYTLLATVNGTRYASGTTTTEVTLTAPGVTQIKLGPTSVTGLVSSSTSAALAMVRVRFVDSGELTHTDAEGKFRLTAVEAGTDRRLELSAHGYQTSIQTVSLHIGRTATMGPTTLVSS